MNSTSSTESGMLPAPIVCPPHSHPSITLITIGHLFFSQHLEFHFIDGKWTEQLGFRITGIPVGLVWGALPRPLLGVIAHSLCRRALLGAIAAADQMPGENAPASSSKDSPSSSDGKQDESCGRDDQSIIQLSEIIIDEVSRNSWLQRPRDEQIIFRVPKETLQATDKRTYEPMFLSIGPYYRGENATEDMVRNEQGKLYILGSIIEKGGPSALKFTQAVASMETNARRCYEGDIQMEREAFCKMLLLDAVQLILWLEFLGPEQEAASRPSSDSATTASTAAAQGSNIVKTRDIDMTLHDLMMLENQIPFFVVKKVYDLRYHQDGNGSVIPVDKLAWGTIKTILSDVPPASEDGVDECKHLVHLCHVYLKPSGIAETTIDAGRYGRFRRASEYYEAGVRFRRWDADDDGSRLPLLDVKFVDGVLRMALQTVNEKTGYILRNVLAYEQKYYRTATSARSSYVTTYVVFMSQLLSGPEDVALLSRRGVMKHLLGNDDDVCALFRGLADGLVFDPDAEHYLNPVGVALQSYCRSSLPRWRSWIVRHRFSNPWLVAAWAFGASAVLGTIVQTVYSILAYYRRN